MSTREVSIFVNGRPYQKVHVPLDARYATIYAVSKIPCILPSAEAATLLADTRKATMKQFNGLIKWCEHRRIFVADIFSDEIEFDDDGELLLKERQDEA